ncbi:hypothetical protein DMX02_01335 [Pseudomonas jessenii]|nr:hypothetical protein DMX02_01335 [Pseudomonas jessenii]
MRLNILVPILTISTLLTGCSAPRPESGAMLKTWSESMANLGVRAVYPLQESLYPGNLLLVPTYPGKSRSDEKPPVFYTYYPVPVGSLDLCKLYKSIQDAPELPQISGYKVTGEPSETKAVTPWQPISINYSHFKCAGFTNSDFRVNRAMAFPAFQFASIVESGAGGNLMAGAVGGKGGVVGSDQYRVTVSVPSATVIRVQVSDMLAAVRNHSYHGDGGLQGVQDVIALLKGVQTVVDSQGKRSLPELLLVSEVYYANSIDVTVETSAAQAAQLAVSTEALVERFERLASLRDQMKLMISTTPATGTTQASGQSQPTTQLIAQSKETAMKNLSREIEETEAQVDKLSKAIVPSAPGVTGAIKYVSSSGVTLTQIFPRPMAIGYRAVGIGLDSFLRLQPPEASLKTSIGRDNPRGETLSRP